MEIRKYRAWHKDEKKMFEVAGIEWNHWTGNTWRDTLHVNINRWPRPDGYGCTLEWCTIDEVDLMQSTGLHDKNGKEIYEGDVVTTGESDAKWLFVWSERHCGFILYRYTKHGRDEQDNGEPEEYGVYPYRDWYVIGNIYDNPELLK